MTHGLSGTSSFASVFLKFFKVENIIENYGFDQLTLSWNNGISIFLKWT